MDKIANRFGVHGDYGKIFAQVEGFDGAVYNKRFRKQTENGEKSRLEVKGKECACGNQKVGYENCGSDLKGGVLLQNHGDYVRSAAGSVHIEKNCGSYARHAHGEDKFEHRLTCHRLGYGN